MEDTQKSAAKFAAGDEASEGFAGLRGRCPIDRDQLVFLFLSQISELYRQLVNRQCAGIAEGYFAGCVHSTTLFLWRWLLRLGLWCIGATQNGDGGPVLHGPLCSAKLHTATAPG